MSILFGAFAATLGVVMAAAVAGIVFIGILIAIDMLVTGWRWKDEP